MCVTNAAKSLKMRPKDLFSWLQARRWIFRCPGTAWLQSGVLSHKATTVTHTNGQEAIAHGFSSRPMG